MSNSNDNLTQPRTWALPEEPPVGTRVIDIDGVAWRRYSFGWKWFSVERGEWVWMGTHWRDLLVHYAPLREATPDDLAKLGINQKEGQV